MDRYQSGQYQWVASRLCTAVAWGLWLACGGCFIGSPQLQDKATPVEKLPPECLAAARRPIPTLSLAALAQIKPQPFLLQAGDVLKVVVNGVEGRLGTDGVLVRVNQSDMVNLPLVGAVRVGGLTLAQTETIIAKAFQDAQLIRKPQVYVEVVDAQDNWIAVTGEVAQPGLYQLPRHASSVLAALAKAGGLGKDASPFVEVARSQQQGVIRLDLLNPETVQSAGQNLWLSNGDLVRVLPWEKEVAYVTGLVASKGPIALPKDRSLDLLSAIGMAGGIDPTIQPTNVVVVRSWNREGRREMKKILVNLVEAAANPDHNLIVQDGDYIAVVHDAASFQRAILLNVFYLRAGADVSVNPVD